MADELVYITTTQVAGIFRVDSSAVRRWVSNGRLKPAITTPGGHYRFLLEDVEALRAQLADQGSAA
jgi:excisionase family DNA binding protein